MRGCTLAQPGAERRVGTVEWPGAEAGRAPASWLGSRRGLRRGCSARETLHADLGHWAKEVERVTDGEQGTFHPVVTHTPECI